MAHPPTQQLPALATSIQRFRHTTDALEDGDERHPSLLPGWSRAHVLTHVARSADSRSGLLLAARDGEVGLQYASEEQRARDIDSGATRPLRALRDDVETALDRLLTAVAEHPADRWDAPGEWLGVGTRPVHRVVPSMRRELEYHHVDLAAGYTPVDWPDVFVAEQLASVTGKFGSRGVALVVQLPDRVLRIGDGGQLRVTGDPAAVLAWLTGRSDGAALRTDPPGPLPDLPPLA